ncbi:MAG: hypothetical protein ACPF9D_13720, partial [Owenweeksia sp.]
KWDQFIHRYKYDANNRIIQVETSQDGYLWDADGRYEYYMHGPLARTEYGDQQVQGTDYAYTVQGWLKNINSGTLHNMRDIGRDGFLMQNKPHYYFGRDAVALGIGYNSEDYSSLVNLEPEMTLNPLSSGTTFGNHAKFYDGNIGTISLGLRSTDETKMRHHGYGFAYYQFSTLASMNMWHGYSGGTDAVIEDNTFVGSTFSLDYSTDIIYDQNGNIKNLYRRGDNGGQNMDALSYNYYANTNQLSYVTDAVSSGNFATDIDNQSAGNYTYDNIGNLVSDSQEEISAIEWTVAGKIASITRTSSSVKPDLEFEYDALGNRITKIEKPRTGGNPSDLTEWIKTHYVRDASGNVMAVYKEQYTYCECREGEPDGDYCEECPSEGYFTLCDCAEAAGDTYTIGEDFNYLSVLELSEFMIYG